MPDKKSRPLRHISPESSAAKAKGWYAVAALLLVGSLVALLLPFTMQAVSQWRQTHAAHDATSQVALWPQGKVADEYDAAQRYNAQLAAKPQNVLGEAPDPFTGSGGKAKSQSETNKTYQRLLDTGGGIMGSVVIPKISVDLPIYHGTSDAVLAQGAGHLYGTSLPVGGASTHAVLTGHRGLPNALLFTRLDEMHKGDVFYIKVLGTTLAYKVDQITVVSPDNAKGDLKIVPGEDRVTLMTCTPYGVNTMRLLVSGERAAIPGQAPPLDDAPKDLTLLWTAMGSLVALGVAATAIVRWLRSSPAAGRHSTRVFRQ
jgi:sortase A